MAATKPSAAKRKKTATATPAQRRQSSIGVDLQTGLVSHVALRDVHPDPDQPRKVFDEKSLAALAANLKARGIYLPILVRYVDGKVTIIDGERRWRAAKLAGLKTVPVLLQDTGTYEAEALQADQVGLNQLGERLRPMEVARQLRRWRDGGKTPNEIAKLLADLGHAPMKPAAIAELAALTDLPEWAQGMIDRDELAAGPASLVVDAVAIPGVEKHLRKALEQDVGYRGTLTARDVKCRVGDALRTIATNLTRTESWYGADAVHFAWKERCKNCEHLVKWDGGGYCLSKKLFGEHQAEAKAAGLGPGGKRPDTKARDALGRITTPEKAAAEAAAHKEEQRERSLGEKVRDYLHAHLLQFIARYIQNDDLPHPNPVEQSLLIWSALKKPGAFGGRSAPGVAYGELRVDAAQHCKVTGLEDLLRTHDDLVAMQPNPEREAVLQLLTELEWRETHVLARHLFGKDLTAVWRLNAGFLDLFRKAELAHLATVHGCELPEGRRSWDALKTDQLKAALLDQEAKLARPQILVDLYEGEIEKPFVRWRDRKDDANRDEAVCIGCGCTQTDPCEEGCGWEAEDVDDTGRWVGVCSSPECAKHLERFDEGDFTLSEDAKARVAERDAFRGAGEVTESGEGSDAEDLEAVEG